MEHREFDIFASNYRTVRSAYVNKDVILENYQLVFATCCNLQNASERAWRSSEVLKLNLYTFENQLQVNNSYIVILIQNMSN